MKRNKKAEQQALVDDICRRAIVEECAKAVPTNWTDHLLTGPSADPTPLNCRGVEKLLRGIQDRIRALAVSNGTLG